MSASFIGNAITSSAAPLLQYRQRASTNRKILHRKNNDQNLQQFSFPLERGSSERIERVREEQTLESHNGTLFL
jgi:hypothetical protein